MKKIEKWEADDGTIFETKEECEKYEKHSGKVALMNEFAKSLPDLDRFINCLRLISRTCYDCDDCENSCPFTDESKSCIFFDSPDAWDIVEITKLFTKINDMNKEKNNNDK